MLSSSAPSLTLQLITISIITLQRTRDHNSIDTNRPIADTYDYIVVGSGTAGSIVGSRLSEDPGASVLVLEAGGPQTVLTDMPAMERRLIGSDVDWSYRTTRQAGAGWAFGGRVPIPRGRVVGGSHNLNFMVYSRGNRRDFDSWSQRFGASGWSYWEVLPYFLRSENQTDREILSANAGYHSTAGRMVVATPPSVDPILQKWMDIQVQQNGIPIVDQNGPGQLGINWFQQTIYYQSNATRSTTASAYLEPYARGGGTIRPNLQVLTRAFVTRLVMTTDNTGGSSGGGGGGVRAAGVHYEHNGREHTVYARREVVLSAGSINSPQLLMLSGIGPRQHLQELNIPVLVDLPVGYNLKDHVYVQLDYQVLNKSLVNSRNDLTVENMYDYYVGAGGPLAQYPLVYQYLNSPMNNETDWPDLQIDLNVAPVGNNLTALVANKAVHRQQWEDYYRPHLGDNTRLGILCFHYRPHSVGRLRLATADPHDQPLLDTNYLDYRGDGYDIRALVAAIRQAMIWANTGQFSQYVRPWQHPIPGCQLCTDAVQAIHLCDQYLECYARSLTMTVGHQVGTCKMGGGGGTGSTDSVVDERLRVRGVRGLRVVDASIYPDITNGNTNAPTAMIGEYGSQLIRDDHQKSYRAVPPLPLIMSY
ncbi:uncharacterized GMC-type oxidoreductase Mb1310-like [Oppia nitens]|uniref:uncharacterized GMC-type oxidoreductase Mb1310-like n=1 Tax=Oppia nitens TaxID=1686743 RepID=UPI0023DAA1C1|nr:uncharacterized GMC-type oxidoreductase Mb1310-like [Oppia nitens]